MDLLDLKSILPTLQGAAQGGMSGGPLALLLQTILARQAAQAPQSPQRQVPSMGDPRVMSAGVSGPTSIGNPGRGRMLGGANARIGAAALPTWQGGIPRSLPGVARDVADDGDADDAVVQETVVKASLKPKGVRKRKVTPRGQQVSKTDTPVGDVDSASPFQSPMKLDLTGGMQIVGTAPEAAELVGSAMPMMGAAPSVQGQQLEPALKKVNPILRALTLGMVR